MPPSKKIKRSEKEVSSTSSSTVVVNERPAEYLHLAEGIISINGLLSSAECEKQLKRCDDNDFEESEVGNSSLKKNVKSKKVRNSDQFEFNDEELSKKVYAKCEDAIKKMVGFSEHSICKFNPVKIDSDWKLYRYKRGQYFDTHIDSGRRVGDYASFITVLIYLNDDYDGGETIFEDDDVTIEPEEGKCVLFLHQLKHSSGEITKKTKYAIKSAVLFEENESYDRQLSEKYCLDRTIVTDLEGSVIVRVGDQEFELREDQISKFPDSMLYTLVTTEMAGDVETKDGVRIFKFPFQDPHIFKRLILPIYNRADHLDLLLHVDPSEEVKIDNEFKFWGLLSPYDLNSISSDAKYSNKQEPWKSIELSLISKPLEYNLEKQKNELESKLAILNAIKGVQQKLEFDFSYKKKYNKPFDLSSKVSSNLSNKYEIIVLNKLYDDNFFLLGSDKELFETCVSLFGGPEYVTVSNLNFIVESHDQERGRGKPKSVVISDESTVADNHYELEIYNQIQKLVEEKKINEPKELEEELDLNCVQVNENDLKTKGKVKQTWAGEYNDEYYPSYSLFVLSGILINVKRLKE